MTNLCARPPCVRLLCVGSPCWKEADKLNCTVLSPTKMLQCSQSVSSYLPGAVTDPGTSQLAGLASVLCFGLVVLSEFWSPPPDFPFQSTEIMHIYYLKNDPFSRVAG